jgi:hypothetical protein
VFAWGILLGAKLFDLRVLAGAWSASPPESLHLLPYGPHYPVDTGEFFIPSSAALLVCSFGALLSGWRTPAKFRLLLAVPAVMILATLAFTMLWFWPHNRALWHVAIGAPDALRDRNAVVAMVRQWIAYDWLRVAMGTVGFICAISAISVPLPAPVRRGTPAWWMRLLYAVAIAGVVAFIAYFVIKGL